VIITLNQQILAMQAFMSRSLDLIHEMRRWVHLMTQRLQAGRLRNTVLEQTGAEELSNPFGGVERQAA
jgi:hypothetical protein